MYSFVSPSLRSCSQDVAVAAQSKGLVCTVTAALFIVFASRSVFNFVSGAGKVTVLIDSSNAGENIAAFAIYALWEMFPVVLLLVTVASGGPVLAVRYKRRQFGVVGTGMSRAHGDAHSSIASYDVFNDSPPNALSDHSAAANDTSGGHVKDDTPPPIIPQRSSSRWRRYRNRTAKAATAKTDTQASAESTSLSEPFLPPAPSRDARIDRVSASVHAEAQFPQSQQAHVQTFLLSDGVDDVEAQHVAPVVVPARAATMTASSKRGLAAGAKARIVSLGGEEAVYGSYDAIGSYGHDFGDSFLGGSPSLVPMAVPAHSDTHGHSKRSAFNRQQHRDAHSPVAQSPAYK